MRPQNVGGGSGSRTSIGSPTGSPLNIRASLKKPAAYSVIVTGSLPVFFQNHPCRPG